MKADRKRIQPAWRAALAPRVEAGSAAARAALRLMDDPVQVISTVQVGITAIGILLGALAEPTVRNLLGEGLPGWLTYMIAFAGVAYLSGVVGELMPKAVTLDRAETMAVLVARPIELIAVGVVLRLKPTDFAGIFVASGGRSCGSRSSRTLRAFSRRYGRRWGPSAFSSLWGT